MKAYSSFTISISGSYIDVLKAVNFLSETVNDQSCWSQFANDCYYDDHDDNEDDDFPELLEEHFEVRETQKCVWIEDIQNAAAELSYLVPCIDFTIKGYIEDNISGDGDMMDFLIEYKKGKLISRTSDWYIHIYMADFEDYYAFAEKFMATDGNPRYTEEDYNGFLECADEWYVLDSGNGEFSTDVPLGKSVKLKIPKKLC